jgi:hypothetical protein
VDSQEISRRHPSTAADMVALISLGAGGVGIAFGIGPVGLQHWRPEARGRP